MSESCARDFVRRMMFDRGFRLEVKKCESAASVVEIARRNGYFCTLEELDAAQADALEEITHGDGTVEAASAGWGVPFVMGLKAVRAYPEEGWEHEYLDDLSV